jgi:hypothetical protein
VAQNLIAKPSELETSAPEALAPRSAKPEAANPIAANPITAEEAKAIADALRASRPGINPVAEVQAKLRAAMQAQPKPSKLQDAAFHAFVVASCALMTVFGVVLGIACVLFGAAMFLFPISAGTALGAFVLATGALFYFLYTRGVAPKSTNESAKASETFEPLAAGRFNATGVA